MYSVQNFNVNEHLSWILSRYSLHNIILFAKINKDIDLNKVQDILKLIKNSSHYFDYSLSSSICGFIRSREEMVITTYQFDSIEAAVEIELNTPFHEGDILCRFKIIKVKKLFYIMLCAHHIISDGLVLIDLLKNILKIYNSENFQLLENDNSVENNIPVSLPKLSEFNSELIQSSTKIKSLIISQQINAKIKAMIKNKGFSYTSLISSILLVAHKITFQQQNINLSIPVSLRNTNNKLSLGFQTSWIDFNIASPKNILCLSSSLNYRMKNSIAEKKYFTNLLRLSDLINCKKNHDELLSSFRSNLPTLCVSNLGNINCLTTNSNKSSSIYIEDFHMVVNCQTYYNNSSSLTCILSTNNQNELTIDFCYPSPAVPQIKILKYISSIQQIISELN